MRVSHLVDGEISATGGFALRIDLSVADIPAGVAVNTPVTFSAAPLPRFRTNALIKQCLVHLTVPFQDTADAAFNTDTISVGLVTGGVAALVAAFEANINGTEVIDTIPGVATPAVPVKNLTDNNQLTITINSMAAKTLSSLKLGKLYILIQYQDPSDQSATKAVPFGGGYV